VTASETIAARQAALAAERQARQQAEARAPRAEALIAHYKLLIAKLRREQYGQSSERGRRLLDQLELQLEELEAGAAEDDAKAAPVDGSAVRPFTRRKPVRTPFPVHLQRERVVIPSPTACPVAGQARQARRDGHGDAGGGAAAVEGHPDRAREVHLPLVREDDPAAGALSCHPARPYRAEPAGDDPLCVPFSSGGAMRTRRVL
jgi:hypothetical protein